MLEKINEGKFLIKDLIDGDSSIDKRIDFQSLNGDEIREAVNLIVSNPYLSERQKHQVLSNTWKVHYRKRPPSIEEFLTEEWIGPTANSLFPHVKETLTIYWQPDSEKRHLILGNAIGTGKSFTAALWSLYITTHLTLMKNNKKFFGLSQATSIVHALISFTMEKAQQLLLQPFFQILLSSPKFHRVKQEEYLERHQNENPNKICWTSAGRMGVLQFYNDVHYILSSSPANLLGLNMISAILSEISFFIEKGFSTEYIWRIYTDSQSRIKSRFEDKYFSGTVIDSSPNDLELSPIDKYIFEGRAAKNNKNMVITGSQWYFLPNKFPEWRKTGKSFPVFRGSQGQPAKLLDDYDLENYKRDDILDVPIDLYDQFESNVIKAVKDFGGWPAGAQGVLVRDDSVIEDMFTPRLKNIYSYIAAPDHRPSENLIWNTIAPLFFIKHDKGYEFYRNPNEKRFLHIDQSETGDIASISMVHPEMTTKGDFIYITDFTIAISPEKGRINLDAIRLFIKDLKYKGRIEIALVTFDQYQSATTISYLKDQNINAEKFSGVDSDPKVYLTYVSYIQAGRVKAGKNIFLKNNLKSLQEITLKTKKKIDHTIGKIIYEDGGKWETSEMGKFAKDVSDSNCGAVWHAIHNYVGAPRYIWEDKKIEKNQSYQSIIKDKVLKEMKEKYGMEVSV